MFFRVMIVWVICWTGVFPASAQSVGTEFSYQAFVMDGGSPADGDYDVVFELWSAEEMGTLLDSISLEDINIDNGVLNAILDYGDAPFSGLVSWIAVGVRPGDATGNYETLEPRQRIRVTPYAIQSQYTSESGPWVSQPSDTIYTEDNVLISEIGPFTSNAMLEIRSDSTTLMPLNITYFGSPSLQVHLSRAVSVGTSDLPGIRGLRVDGVTRLDGGTEAYGEMRMYGLARFIDDTSQSIYNHGTVKSGIKVNCSAASPSIASYFNTAQQIGAITALSASGIPGRCSIAFPYLVDDAYLVAMAEPSFGGGGFAALSVSCSPSGSTATCQVFDGNGTLTDGNIQILVY